jgi:hypothetical protein
MFSLKITGDNSTATPETPIGTFSEGQIIYILGVIRLDSSTYPNWATATLMLYANGVPFRFLAQAPNAWATPPAPAPLDISSIPFSVLPLISDVIGGIGTIDLSYSIAVGGPITANHGDYDFYIGIA